MADLLVPVTVADTFDGLSKLIRAQTASAPAAPVPPPMLDMTAIMMIKNFDAQEEGDKLTAYQDQAGVWTIGKGHTPAYPGQTITQAQSDMLFAADLLKFADTILPLLTLIPGVGQYAALISLAFNIGIGIADTATHPGTGFKGSTVLRMHNAGNFQAAADAFHMWDKTHIDGQLVTDPPLLTRRQAERAIYLGTTPMPVA